MSVRFIQNSGGYRASGGVDRVPRSEPRGTASRLRRITRIVLFNMSSRPDSGLILFLAKPPTGASRSSRRCGRKALRITFTAVGRDINILSRLELLCKDVGRPLLMTDAFAGEVAAPVFEIGHFELRGFRQHQSVYGLR